MVWRLRAQSLLAGGMFARASARGRLQQRLTREQAVEKARLHWGDSSQSIGENLVAILEDLGLVWFKDEPSPKQVLKDILTSLTLPPQSDVADPKMGGWRIGRHGADMILKAL
jgi:hypothetical protein